MISSGTFGLIPLFTIPLMGNMEMNESNILFYRFLFSTLMMGAVCLLHKSTLKINMKHLISIIGLGALYALTALFLIYSYHYITSGVATTIHFLYPICVSFLMVVFFKEQKSKSLFLAASLSLIGVALMCRSGGGSIRLMGIGLAALTILTYGIYIVALNQLDIGKLPAEVLTFYVLLGGCVIFFIYSLFTAGNILHPQHKSRILYFGIGISIYRHLRPYVDFSGKICRFDNNSHPWFNGTFGRSGCRRIGIFGTFHITIINRFITDTNVCYHCNISRSTKKVEENHRTENH